MKTKHEEIETQNEQSPSALFGAVDESVVSELKIEAGQWYPADVPIPVGVYRPSPSGAWRVEFKEWEDWQDHMVPAAIPIRNSLQYGQLLARSIRPLRRWVKADRPPEKAHDVALTPYGDSGIAQTGDEIVAWGQYVPNMTPPGAAVWASSLAAGHGFAAAMSGRKLITWPQPAPFPGEAISVAACGDLLAVLALGGYIELTQAKEHFFSDMALAYGKRENIVGLVLSDTALVYWSADGRADGFGFSPRAQENIRKLRAEKQAAKVVPCGDAFIVQRFDGTCVGVGTIGLPDGVYSSVAACAFGAIGVRDGMIVAGLAVPKELKRLEGMPASRVVGALTAVAVIGPDNALTVVKVI
jgi:hypothetical protein